MGVTMTPEPRTSPKASIYRVPATTPLGQAVNAFLLDCEARNLTAGTLRFYWQRLAHFLAFLDGNGITDPANITPATLRTFIASFSDHSPYYQHQHARAVKTFCGWMVREELLTVSPMPRRANADGCPKMYLTPSGRVTWRACWTRAQNDRDRAIVLTLLDSGVRASELLALDVGDLDTLTGALRVRLGKGRKQRVAFVGTRTRKALASLSDRPGQGRAI